jgi:RNA polymerase sigma-70 factor (ECF subfamily)
MARMTTHPEPLADEFLVERLRQGDREAFDALYQRYFERVFRFVDRRMANRADAEEVVQEAFINLFSSIHTFRGDAPFGAWVFGVARRTLASRFKRKRHHTVPLGEDETENALGQGGDSPLEAYECVERLRRIRSAAEQDLTPEQRVLFELHHLEDRSIQEICRVVRRSEDSVKSHLYRARKLLLAR